MIRRENLAKEILDLKYYVKTSWYDGVLADFDAYRRRVLIAFFSFGLIMPLSIAIISLGEGEFSILIPMAGSALLLASGLLCSLRASRKAVGAISHAVLVLYPILYILAVVSPHSHRTYVILLIAMPSITEILSSWNEKLVWFIYSSAFIMLANILSLTGLTTSWIRDYSAGEIVIAHAATTIVAALSYLGDRQMMRSLESQARRIVRDEATGLPTATALGQALEALGESIVCVVSLDNFFELSALFGYDSGDEIVKNAASRLVAVTRELGGICFKLHGRDLGVAKPLAETNAAETRSYVQGLWDALGQPVELKGKFVEIRYSIGYTFCKDGNAVKALNEAGGALWLKTKPHGIFRHEIPLGASAVELSFSRLATLSRCVREGGLEAYFQPVIRLRDGRIAWYEALLRVRGDDGQIEPPLVYLDIARSTGYWGAITDFMLARALERLRSGFGSVSINIGIEDLIREDFRRAAAEGAALARERGCEFILELLETDSSNLTEGQLELVRELQVAGCLIAIDDFGIGYSNYSRLFSFPFDIVKFDMSLVRMALGEPAVGELFVGLAKFCSGIGVLTVAEGLESEEAVRYFVDMGLDFGQGYFWSRAVPSHDASPASAGKFRPPDAQGRRFR